MANTNSLDAALALWRFGLGAKEGSIASIQNDPRDFVREEVAERAVPTPSGPSLHSTQSLLAALRSYQEEVKAERERQPVTQVSAAPAPTAGSSPMVDPDKAAARAALAGMMSPPVPAGAEAQQNQMQPGQIPNRQSDKTDVPASKRRYFPQDVLIAEADARFNGTIHQPMIGFGERLAMFWANHFAVAIGKSGDVHVLAGAFEREAIRPHLFGRFEDLLLAVETHPAMLVFLDNQQSVGPDSPANKNGKRGLNENLAREIMELHTLGVDGGYEQGDVTSLARIITGWTVYRNDDKPGPQGSFSFNTGAHEPGDHTVMGVTYGEGGVEQGRQALGDLARHPATARHIAFKLVRHFIADEPPPGLVDRLTAAYTKTKGDLSAVYMAMVTAEEAWDPRLTKMRMPMEYVSAILRATGIAPKPEQILSILNALGQPLWNPAGPNGFSDVTEAWASSKGLATRIDAASLLSHQVPPNIDPRSFVVDRLGPLLSSETLTAVSRAETKQQGLSLAFLSPEFQRR